MTTNSKKKKHDDEVLIEVEELNFDSLDIQVIDVHPDILQDFEKRLRKIKREEEN